MYEKRLQNIMHILIFSSIKYAVCSFPQIVEFGKVKVNRLFRKLSAILANTIII